MPKKNADYPARLDLFVKDETRILVIAIAYHMGKAGKYAKACRPLLEAGIKAYIDGLSARDKRDLDAIVGNVNITHGNMP